MANEEIYDWFSQPLYGGQEIDCLSNVSEWLTTNIVVNTFLVLQSHVRNEMWALKQSKL